MGLGEGACGGRHPTLNVDAEEGARVPNPEAADAEVIPKDPEILEAIARRM